MKISLPRLMAVTDRAQMRPGYEEALERALSGPFKFVQFREKDLSDEEARTLANVAADACKRHNGVLVINDRLQLARELGSGLHVSEARLEQLPSLRRSLGMESLLGISCHSQENAIHAKEFGADYVVFGSVFETPSHPDIRPAGLATLRQVCEAVNIPVYAIGGINADNAKDCFENGAYGIAAIRAAWEHADTWQNLTQIDRKSP